METHQLDKTDLQLLKILQENGRISIKELAQRVHLSPTPVFDRVRRLEASGVIERYTTVLNAAKLGQGFLVFCSVKLRRMGKDIAHDFVERIKDIPFPYTSLSLNEVCQQNYNLILQCNEPGDNGILFNVEKPQPVRYEQCFEGIKPV